MGSHSSKRPDERADHAALGLTPFAEEDHVMTCDEGMLERRQDAVGVTEHARDDGLALRDPYEHVAADLLFNRTECHPEARSSPRVEGSDERAGEWPPASTARGAAADRVSWGPDICGIRRDYGDRLAARATPVQ